MTATWRRPIPLLIGVGVFTTGLFVFSSVAPIVLLADGLYALALLIAAAGWGAHAARALLGGAAAPAKQVLLAIAIGLGVLALLTLSLGVAGLLSSAAAWTLLALGGLLGVMRLIGTARDRSTTSLASSAVRTNTAGGSIAWTALALQSLIAAPIAICAAILFFGATLPPGSLWLAEANGYDVLEYHLQVPREYFADGRIHFLAHNVYAQFPQQMEMLYLLLMHLLGDPYAAAIPAQILHALCGIATIAALAAWTPAGWGRWIVTLIAATVPWIAYVGCLAYVELGMTFFAAVAAGLIGDLIARTAVERATLSAPVPNAANREPAGTPAQLRELIGAGICAGLAAGCKYTALGLVVAPLGLALLAGITGEARRRLFGAAQFGLVAAVAFSPWLVRNSIQAGNPIYPFGFEFFGGHAWSAGQAQQWKRGHEVASAHAGVGGRFALGWSETIASPMYGPAISAGAAIALIFAWRRRAAWAFAVWLLAGLVAWAALTHMPGRFAIVLIIPACRLIAVGADAIRKKLDELRVGRLDPIPATGARAAILFIALAIPLTAAIGVIHQLRSLVQEQNDFWQRRAGVSLAELTGRTMEFVRQNPLVNDTPPDAIVHLVGDAAVFYVPRRLQYTVAFNRDPWLEFGRARSAAAAVQWLAAHNVTYVVFSWPEIARLGRTYGFPEFVTPAWADELAAAGLRRRAQSRDARGNPVREVFEVVIDEAPPQVQD